MSEEKEEWLNERKKGIGGSDAGAICGISPYRTPLQVWQDKRGMSNPFPDNEKMLWGRILEPAVRQRYSDITGRIVRVPDAILHHPKLDFMLANIDGFTDDKRGVEVKTASSTKDWGEPGTDEIPLPYIFQVQHYMIITGIEVFDVPVLINGSDFRIYEVPADKELQEMIIEKEAAFWKMVKEATPPDPVNYQDVVRRFRQSKSEMVTATIQTVEAYNRLKQLRMDIANLELAEEIEKSNILLQMKEADTLIDVTGEVLATWKSGNPVNRVDLKSLQKEMPEIYTKYLKPSEAVRRFLLKGENK